VVAVATVLALECGTRARLTQAWRPIERRVSI
jgi:hypothetical protein